MKSDNQSSPQWKTHRPLGGSNSTGFQVWRSHSSQPPAPRQGRRASPARSSTDKKRSHRTIVVSDSTTRSTSAKVVVRPRLKRMGAKPHPFIDPHCPEDRTHFGPSCVTGRARGCRHALQSREHLLAVATRKTDVQRVRKPLGRMAVEHHPVPKTPRRSRQNCSVRSPTRSSCTQCCAT